MKYIEKNSKTIRQPVSVIGYNFNICAIGKAGMQTSFVECLQKSLKWYRTLFLHTVNLSIYKLIFA